jgi:non-ribosomal peptide synthetase component E (peptide arylation enzyme)
MQPKLHSDAACAAYHEAGLWGDKLIVDYIDDHARRDPAKAAIVDCRETITYATLVRRSENLAAAFKAIGLGHGDVVAIRSANWAELPITHLATNRIGAIFLPLSEGFAEADILHLLRQSQARVLLTASTGWLDPRAFLEKHRSELALLKEVISLREAGSGVKLSFDSLANDDSWRIQRGTEYLTRARADADAPSHVMVSSGTTGMPKCSLFSDNNSIVKVLLQYCKSVAEITSADVAAAIAPAATGSTGYNYPILAPLLAGGTSVMLEHWKGSNPEEALHLIEQHGCTYAVVVPTQLAKLIAIPDVHKYDLRHLRLITNSGAKLPAPVAEAAESLFHSKIQSVYGCSEAGAATMTAVSDPPEKRFHTAGRALLGQELVIKDEAGNPVERNHIGEVCWRGAHKTFGFLNDPESTRTVWDAAGWLNSGDLGTIDDDGYLRIVGRKKDMIIRGGQNINPRAIEEVLLRHSSVVDVAIASVPDPVLGERVGAFVVGRPSQALSLAELSRFVLDQGLAKWNQPELLFLVDDLPRNAGGKVDKARLLKLHGIGAVLSD